MKRELLQNVKVMPYTSGDVLDRSGFLSAVLGIKVSSITGNPNTCKVVLKIEHGDSEAGDFAPVTDEMNPCGSRRKYQCGFGPFGVQRLCQDNIQF